MSVPVRDDIATRGHAVVLLDDAHVLLLRACQNGSVTYLAPGVASSAGETPGRAAARAALEYLGLEVQVEDLLFADMEMGAEHFFFLATPANGAVPAPSVARLSAERLETAVLRRAALLGYPVRPVAIARLVPRARTPAGTPAVP